jgi:hypothetical protein
MLIAGCITEYLVLLCMKGIGKDQVPFSRSEKKSPSWEFDARRLDNFFGSVTFRV